MIEPDSKRRRALGHPYEAPPITLGEAIDGTLARINATRGVSEKTRAYNALSAKVWAPLRETRVPILRRATIEDLILERAKEHPRSAKNELELLKRVLHDARGRSSESRRCRWYGTSGTAPTDTATAARPPRRCSTLAAPI